jgi:hypothetical protein
MVKHKNRLFAAIGAATATSAIVVSKWLVLWHGNFGATRMSCSPSANAF